jgi:hypothetical protein
MVRKVRKKLRKAGMNTVLRLANKWVFRGLIRANNKSMLNSNVDNITFLNGTPLGVPFSPCFKNVAQYSHQIFCTYLF